MTKAAFAWNEKEPADFACSGEKEKKWERFIQTKQKIPNPPPRDRGAALIRRAGAPLRIPNLRVEIPAFSPGGVFPGVCG